MRKMLLLLSMSVCFLSVSHAQQVPDSVLQQYVGKYVFPEGSVIGYVTVTLENGALSITSSAGVSALVKKEEDLYEITAFQGTAKFKRDDNKKIIGVTVDARGYLLEGTKAEGSSLTSRPQNKNFSFLIR
jgi:hypothetical protein